MGEPVPIDVRTLSFKPQPDDSNKESTIFIATPSAKAFIGSMIWAGICSIITIVVLIIATMNILFSIVIPPLFIGGGTALSIWVATHMTEYKLTDQRFFVKKGLIAKHLEELELYRVKDVSVRQGILQRLLGFGSVTILSTDDSTPRLTMVGVSQPTELKERIRTAYKIARKRENVQSTEFIPS